MQQSKVKLILVGTNTTGTHIGHDDAVFFRNPMDPTPHDPRRIEQFLTQGERTRSHNESPNNHMDDGDHVGTQDLISDTIPNGT